MNINEDRAKWQKIFDAFWDQKLEYRTFNDRSGWKLATDSVVLGRDISDYRIKAEEPLSKQEAFDAMISRRTFGPDQVYIEHMNFFGNVVLNAKKMSSRAWSDTGKYITLEKAIEYGVYK